MASLSHICTSFSGYTYTYIVYFGVWRLITKIYIFRCYFDLKVTNYQHTWSSLGRPKSILEDLSLNLSPLKKDLDLNLLKGLGSMPSIFGHKILLRLPKN